MTENNVEVTEVETEVYDAENQESRKNDFLKNGLAVGIGLLALDGAVHVGKWGFNKGKQLFGKAKAKMTEKKQNKQQDQPQESTDSGATENNQ